MTVDSIVSKTEKFLEIPSVTLFEQPFMQFLNDQLTESGFEVDRRDRLLAVKRKGTPHSSMISAHIDRNGIIATYSGFYEYSAFHAKKVLGVENLASKTVFKKSGARFVGETVLAYDASGNEIESGKVVRSSFDFERQRVFFDMEGMPRLPDNTPIAYKTGFKQAEGKISGQIDNAICVAVAVQLLEDGYDGTVLFTTEEECGRSWHHTAMYLQDSQRETRELVVLDTTPYADSRAIDSGLIVLRNKDAWAEFNQGLVARLKEVCETQGIAFEMKDEVIEAANAELAEGVKPKALGKTELGRIIKHTSGRYSGATMQLPAMNYHTNHETTSLRALENYYNALTKVLSGL